MNFNYEVAFCGACWVIGAMALAIGLLIWHFSSIAEEREWAHGQLVKARFGHLPYNKGVASPELEHKYTIVRTAPIPTLRQL